MVKIITDTIKDAINEIPPEVIADLMEEGVCMAGGASQLQGFTERLTDELHMRVWLAEDSMTCVARGAGMILDDLDNLGRFLVGLERGAS